MRTSPSEYFKRQATIPDVGAEGVEKLRRSRVAVVGVGGVGSAVADYLARSGVGYVRLIDQDIVEPTNLHRLPGVGGEHVYHPKAEAVAEVLGKTNQWATFEPVVETLTENNVAELLTGVELVVDGLDNFQTRYRVNRYSCETKTPYIFASAIAAQGHVGVFCPPETPCLECAFPGVIDGNSDSCEVLGILPTAVGVAATIASNETVKALLGLPSGLKGRLLTLDMMGPKFLVSTMQRRDDCEACAGSVKSQISLGVVSVMCGGRTFNVIPEHNSNLDLAALSHSLAEGQVLAKTESILSYQAGDLTVSLFRTGRVLINGVDDRAEALRIAREIWSKAEPVTISQPAA